MTPGPGLPLCEVFARYEPKHLRGANPASIGHFYTAISHFGEFLRREPTTVDLTDDLVTDFMWGLVETRGIVHETAVSYVKKLLALWRFGCRQRLCEVWPEVELLVCPERDPIAWTEAEVQILWRALVSQEGRIGPSPARFYWAALTLAFWDSAERVGAVLQLRPQDVNLCGAWMTFRAETRKGKLRDRGYPLHAQTVHAFKLLLESSGRRQLIFEAPFGEQTLRLHYKAILRDAGLPYDRKRLFHCMRKTVASHFEALGHDAMELLDHSSRAVTKKYLSPQIVRPPRPADVMWRPTG